MKNLLLRNADNSKKKKKKKKKKKNIPSDLEWHRITAPICVLLFPLT